VVSRLERWRIPRLAAAAGVVGVLVALVGSAGYAIRGDLSDAVAELPAAARKFRHTVVNAEQKAPGPITHMKAAAAELDKAAAEASGKPPPPAAAPVPPQATVSSQLQDFTARKSGEALTVLAEIVIALLLALLLLAAGDKFRRKVARIAGASLARRRVTIEVLNEIDSQIQAYMMTMLAANVLIALATAGALLLLGVPNAWMLGGVAGLMHVIPYAGTIASTAIVGVATFVDTASAGDALVAAGVVAAIAAGIGMGLGTWMQGRAARMNGVALFIGVLFFGWLWGGWGLLLGVPILAVLKTISDRVDAMQPISELLGS
jgi:predicted PurR-regulated permease PerM